MTAQSIGCDASTGSANGSPAAKARTLPQRVAAAAVPRGAAASAASQRSPTIRNA